jgi:hypothetical protein
MKGLAIVCTVCILCLPVSHIAGSSRESSTCALLWLQRPHAFHTEVPATRQRNSCLMRLKGGLTGEPRHAWDQTPDEVQIYIFHDGIGDVWQAENKNMCALTISNSSVVFYFLEESGAKWSLDLPLLFAVDPIASHYKVRKDRISIKLKKLVRGAVWPSLRAVDKMTLDDMPPLPESFRAPKEAIEAEAAQVAQMKPRDLHDERGDWEAMGQSERINVIAAERKTLETLLGAAKEGGRRRALLYWHKFTCLLVHKYN